jgi:hypothetical protein
MLARWLTKRVEFSLGGQKWPLVFTHRALFFCEELTGMDMLTTSLVDSSATLIRALIFAALDCAGAKCSLPVVGEEINRVGISRARIALVTAWAASMVPVEPETKDSYAEHRPTWLDAWAIARQDLKLSDNEWLDMTPRQFAALQKARLKEMQREELLVGKIEAAVKNYSMRAPKKWVSPHDLMIHKFPKPTTPTFLSGEFILSQFKRLEDN